MTLEGALTLFTGKTAVEGPIDLWWGPWLCSDEDRNSQAIEGSLCLPLQKVGALTPGGTESRHFGGPGLDFPGPGTEHGKLGAQKGRCWGTYIHPSLCSHDPLMGRSWGVPGLWHSCRVFWRQGIHPLAWGWGWVWTYKTLFPEVGSPPSPAVGTNHTWVKGNVSLKVSKARHAFLYLKKCISFWIVIYIEYNRGKYWNNAKGVRVKSVFGGHWRR